MSSFTLHSYLHAQCLTENFQGTRHQKSVSLFLASRSQSKYLGILWRGTTCWQVCWYLAIGIPYHHHQDSWLYYTINCKNGCLHIDTSSIFSTDWETVVPCIVEFKFVKSSVARKGPSVFPRPLLTKKSCALALWLTSCSKFFNKWTNYLFLCVSRFLFPMWIHFQK